MNSVYRKALNFLTWICVELLSDGTEEGDIHHSMKSFKNWLESRKNATAETNG